MINHAHLISAGQAITRPITPNTLQAITFHPALYRAGERLPEFRDFRSTNQREEPAATMTINSTDALKYAAAILKSRTDWVCDSIGGAMCDHDHELELDAVTDTVTEVVALAAQFGDPRRYSDGRLVESSAEIARGLVTHHVWHPDVAAEAPQSWRSSLPSDPDVPSPGVYEVSLDPVAQDIHVRVVRAV